ncbi:MAG: hypothetical protein KGL39_44540, partial [Patescibacteria group bacterium]|nr:hypothetical protein [Patescibacteria group bacterium]
YSGNQPVYAYRWAAHSLGTAYNILCRDDASFETGTGTFSSFANCTIAQSSAKALDGTHSMSLTSLASGLMAAGTGKGTFPATYYPVTAGTSYTASAYFLPATTVQSVFMGIDWYTSAGAVISTPTGSSVSEVSGQWVQASFTDTAPATAAYARVVVEVTSASAASEVHYVDNVALTAGNSATWSYPGLGVGSRRTLSYSSSLLTSVT